jgi:phosphatidylserine/phosphatidylglycerophosphate/cardiolipin synthase-like enzyme
MPENATASAHMAEDPRIVELYPNPVADGDPGEYVLVAFPSETNLTGWTISDDGRGRVELPNRTVSGRVAFSLRPERTRNHTEVSVQEASGRLQLANGGDTVQLRENGTVVDAVSYGRAAESERWLAEEDEGAWRPLGFTPREPVVTDPGGATVFTLPDAPDLAVEQLETADSRLLLAGYTLTAGRITEALLDAHRRGTTVSVLVDSSPVGGMSDRQASVLDRLSAAGIEVRVLGGAHARFSFHHAKYAVVDDRALVTTENWKPSGTGGKASRGWGVVIRDRATADELATLFEADSGWRDAIPWAEYRTEVETVAAQPASESYRAAFEPKRVTVESARVLVTPDNAEGELAGLLRSATDSIRIQQVAIGGRNHSLLRATLGAARRGVRVEIQLSSAWYVEEENRRLADRLRNLASTEGLDLTVELVEPRSRFEKVHTKGVVVDDRHVVVGSINWNDHSVRENREVAVVLTGPEIAAYYDRVLTADRRGGVWRLPAGIALVVALVWILTTGLVWRHLGWRRPALP